MACVVFYYSCKTSQFWQPGSSPFTWPRSERQPQPPLATTTSAHAQTFDGWACPDCARKMLVNAKKIAKNSNSCDPNFLIFLYELLIKCFIFRFFSIITGISQENCSQIWARFIVRYCIALDRNHQAHNLTLTPNWSAGQRVEFLYREVIHS